MYLFIHILFPGLHLGLETSSISTCFAPPRAAAPSGQVSNFLAAQNDLKVPPIYHQ